MASPIDALITTLENIVLVENKSSCIKWSRFKSDAQKEVGISFGWRAGFFGRLFV
jgi:hypothetical protein